MISVVNRLFLIICIITLLSACAKKNVVVLLPGQDGKTGAIEFSNQGGSQKLNAPNEATSVSSIKTAPGSPEIMREEDVKKIFGEAMAAAPPMPAHYTMYFLHDSTRFTDESARLFEEIIASIKKINPAEVSIVGHTDRVGSREQNFRLGFERATQVKKLLVSRGVDAGLIEIESHGEDNPLVKTDDNVSEPKNRRVEIIVR
jgi:outer membrane protein OmpA-like peptidoglycan-associated protein